MQRFSRSTRRGCAFAFGIGLMLAAAPARSAIIYDNGPYGGLTAWGINQGFAVEDSFVVGGFSTLTGVNFTSWVNHGDTPLTVDWQIVTIPGFPFPPIASGVANLTNTFIKQNGGADIYNESFSLPGVTLNAGTFWLALDFGTTAGGGPMYWDENDGPSTAWTPAIGYVNHISDPTCAVLVGSCSQTFQIVGRSSISPTPEPGTMGLGAGALLLAALGWRRMKA